MDCLTKRCHSINIREGRKVSQSNDVEESPSIVTVICTLQIRECQGDCLVLSVPSSAGFERLLKLTNTVESLEFYSFHERYLPPPPPLSFASISSDTER